MNNKQKVTFIQMNTVEKKAFKYCCGGSEEAFMALVPSKVKIDYQIQSCEVNRIKLEYPSFLHCAAVHGKDKMAMLLIDLGINIDLRDSKVPFDYLYFISIPLFIFPFFLMEFHFINFFHFYK